MNWLRVFLIGGLTSYRALFGWLNPWIYVPMLVITPLFQLLFFAYLGRAAHVASDGFFVVGNALIGASLPCLWGTGWGIGAERRTQTLGVLLASPASRIALFAGRALPSIVNGLVVGAFCFLAGRVLLDYHPPLAAAPGIALATLAAAFSCAALGLSVGALGLRGRNVTALNNIVLIVFLFATGANVPLERLPSAVRTASTYLPLTHAIEVARRLAGGAPLGRVLGSLGAELAVGAAYAVVGIALLKIFELSGRRTAAFETF